MLRLPSPNARKGICRFFMVLAIILLVCGGTWTWKTTSFISSARQAVGKIEGYEQKKSTKRSRSGGTRRTTTHRPRFTFQDDQGREHKVTSSVGGSKGAFKVGEEVEVLYDPQNPTDARINTFIQMWLGPLVIGGVGLVFLSLGVAGRYWGG
jgi:hypothetical protein